MARHLIFSSTKKRNTSFGFSELRQFLYGKESGRTGKGRLPPRVRGCENRVEGFPSYPPTPSLILAPPQHSGTLLKCICSSPDKQEVSSYYFECSLYEAASPSSVRIPGYHYYSPQVQPLPQGRCSVCSLLGMGVGVGWADRSKKGPERERVNCRQTEGV